MDDEDGFDVCRRARGKYALPVRRRGAEDDRRIVLRGVHQARVCRNSRMNIPPRVVELTTLDAHVVHHMKKKILPVLQSIHQITKRRKETRLHGVRQEPATALKG